MPLLPRRFPTNYVKHLYTSELTMLQLNTKKLNKTAQSPYRPSDKTLLLSYGAQPDTSSGKRAITKHPSKRKHSYRTDGTSPFGEWIFGLQHDIYGNCQKADASHNHHFPLSLILPPTPKRIFHPDTEPSHTQQQSRRVG